MLVKLIPLAPVALLAFSVVASACLSLAPTPGHPVAALFPPWWTQAKAFDAFAAAGGNVVRLTGLPTLLVAAAAPDGLNGRLIAFGAILVVDSQRLGGCETEP